MTWTSLLARHLRGSALRWAALAVVVGVTAALVLVWPRWLDRTTTAELRRDLGGTSVPLVDPVAVTPRLPLWGDTDLPPDELHDALWAATLDPLRAHRDDLAEPLRSLLGEPQALQIHREVTILDETVPDRPAMYLQPTVSSAFVDHAVFVDGQAPTARRLTADELNALWQEGGDRSDPLRLEIALSVDAAEELRWAVGDTRPVFASLPRATPVEAVLTGIFTADDAASGFWQHSSLLLNPTVVDNPNVGIVVTARAVVAPGQGAQLAQWLADSHSARIWFPLDVDRVSAANATTVAAQLETDLTTVPQEWGPGYQVATEAPRIIDGVLGRRTATEAVLGLAVAAPAGVLLALLALAAQVIVAPRQGALTLVRERGAAPRQTRWLLGVEAAVVTVPAAALGAAVAVVALPAHMSPAWWAAPAAIAAAPVVSLLGGSRTPRPRLRLVAEIALIVLAGAGTAVLRQRGVTAAGADPLGVATPLLLALVVAVVCARLLPALLHPVAARLAARSDLVAPLGAALAARRRPSVVAAMATLAGTAVAVLGVLATVTLTQARSEAALRDVGADVRIASYLDEATIAALRDLPEVTALASVATSGTVSIVGENVATGFATVYAADAELTAVQARVPGAVAVPSAGGAVVADRLGARVGDELTLHPGATVTATVTDLAPRIPGITYSGGWVLIDRQVLLDLDRPARPTTTLLALTPDAGDVTERVRAVVGPVPTVTTWTARVAELDGAPTARALSTGLVAVALVGLGSAAAAVALGLARREGERTRIVAVLRTMGLPPRAELRLVLWEVVPLLALSLLAGVGLGFGLAALLLGSTDLRPFTGGDAQPELVVHAGGLAAALGGVVLVAGTAVVVSAWAAARRSAAVVLRAGEEPQ